LPIILIFQRLAALSSVSPQIPDAFFNFHIIDTLNVFFPALILASISGHFLFCSLNNLPLFSSSYVLFVGAPS